MHRAESILIAIEAAVTGLASTGASVLRGYGVQLPALPGLVVRMGADAQLQNFSAAQVARRLEVAVEINVEQAADSDSQLNQVRAEVYAALMAAPQLGLGFVSDTRHIVDDEPEQKDLAQPIVRQVMLFQVDYQHSYQSAES